MLDPDIAKFIGEPPPALPLTANLIPMLRDGMIQAGRALPSPDIAAVEDFDADGVPVRLYRRESPSPLPVLVFLHGGGWLLGDLETHDAMHRHLADRARCAVLAVGYRLAPEHPYPAAFEDVATAWDWIVRRAEGLGLDSNRMALGGESAGGNLAAALTLRLRGSDKRQPDFQLLVHPATDLRFGLPSFDEVKAPGLDRDYLEACVSLYAGQADLTDPFVSPLCAEDHGRLPTAVVFTAEEDPLRDDGEYYARKLTEAGTQTFSCRLPGLPHGFMFLPTSIPAVSDAFDKIAELLVRYFAMPRYSARD